MNLRKKLPLAFAAAATIAGSLALAAPNASAYPSQPCTEATEAWHAWDGPGYAGQEYYCGYSEAQGWHWQPI
ncbi:hypothetical protein F3087_05635 [Nocardia colli]|uniref:Uncharacterized protein n=1 Tax=Nocardia colli TaxID=2545717 RepID=A0A5N0EPA1_9NOCA|nr:hypothetical protein [Nocardia colli]KAA8890726.1 hypothetical protein F3087_05635 [Nocardia colli]